MNHTNKIKVALFIAGLFFLTVSSFAMSKGRFESRLFFKESNSKVTAFLKDKVGPADVALFYDDRMLATLSIYGTRLNEVAWLVTDNEISCADFEIKQSHLSVKIGGEMLAVKRYACHTR